MEWYQATLNSDVDLFPRDDLHSNPTPTKRKIRKYADKYLAYGFTYTGPEGDPKPQCVLCGKILCNESMKPAALRRHQEAKHKADVGQPIEFFRKKLLQLYIRQASLRPTPELNLDEGPSRDGLAGVEERGSELNDDDGSAIMASPDNYMSEGGERDPTPAPVAAATPPKPESYQLRHNNHLNIVLEALARDEAFMDVTLTAQGRSLKAHKSVLSAVSPYFKGVLRDNPCQHPIIIMPRDVRFEELFSIVNYIYKGEMTVAAEDLSSLLKTAEVLQVSGLAPSDSTATVNPFTAPNIRSSSTSSTSSLSNLVKILPKPPKESNARISNAPSFERPKSPEMINPSDFLDMSCVKEEVTSGGEEEESARVEIPEETLATSSPKSSEPTTSSSMYNVGNDQNIASHSSSQMYDDSVKMERERDPLAHTSATNADPAGNITIPFSCHYCKEQHRGKENMVRHLRLQHPTKPGFICNCGMFFIRDAPYQAHCKVCSSVSSC